MGHLSKLIAKQFENPEDRVLNPDLIERLGKLLPVLMCLVDALAGKPNTGMTYLALWCRQTRGFVWVQSEDTLAWESGFRGQRGRDTWRKRLALLQEFGFIETKPRKPYGVYVLLLNPVEIALDIDLESSPNDIALRYQDQLFSRAIELGFLDES